MWCLVCLLACLDPLWCRRPSDHGGALCQSLTTHHVSHESGVVGWHGNPSWWQRHVLWHSKVRDGTSHGNRDRVSVHAKRRHGAGGVMVLSKLEHAATSKANLSREFVQLHQGRAVVWWAHGRRGGHWRLGRRSRAGAGGSRLCN